MAKFCANCGAQMNDDAVFCPGCGTSTNGGQNNFGQPNGGQNNFGQPNGQYTVPNYNTGSSVGLIKKRELVISIILCFVTCGIYPIIWFIGITDDANKLYPDDFPSGGMAFLFSLLTCGIYTIYWFYKMGKKINAAGQKYGKNIEDRSVLYIVLALIGLGIVNYALIQSDLNQFA